MYPLILVIGSISSFIIHININNSKITKHHTTSNSFKFHRYKKKSNTYRYKYITSINNNNRSIFSIKTT